MKVKELIEQLQTLEPDREVWVLYDSIVAFEMKVQGEMTNWEAEAYWKKKGVKAGDYYERVG